MTRASRGKTFTPVLTEAREQRKRMTDAETLLWEKLRDRRLQGIKFRRLHPIGPFILDFYSVSHRLAIEVDGRVHQQPSQADYDTERTLMLNDLGIRVIRFSNDQIETDIESVLSAISEACSKQ